MRKHVLNGRGMRTLVGSAVITAASWITTLTLAAGIMNLAVVRQPNEDLQVNWGKHSNASAAYYEVVQCPYVSAPALKCVDVTTITANPAYDEYSTVIAAANVLPEPNAVVKVIVQDAALTELARENVRIYGSVAPTPTQGPDGSTTTYPLAEGCQLNIAVGQWSGEAMKRAVDAGGVVTVNDAGAVYQMTFKRVGIHEDDAGLVDLRDFEHECFTNLPVVVQQ